MHQDDHEIHRTTRFRLCVDSHRIHVTVRTLHTYCEHHNESHFYTFVTLCIITH